MELALKDINVYQNGAYQNRTVTFSDGRVVSSVSSIGSEPGHLFLFPGFADVHVHLREPGFSYKETIQSGTMAAAHGGYTAICAMPNLDPVPDTPEHLAPQLSLIERTAAIPVYPYGAITMGEKGEEPAQMLALAPQVIAFSDDGRGVQNAQMMRQAMELAKQCGRIIAAHCEDNSLLCGGYIHDGAYAAAHGHKGICSESEWGPIARDLRLAEQTGCAYHVCHISCRKSVELIRAAKKRGVDVTCETAPHYLVLDDSMLKENGRFKMNPPLRSPDDRQALLEGLCDGTIDMIATDHAPHAAAEKDKGLQGSLNGIVGLETAFPVLYTELVRKKIITLNRLIELMAVNPRVRFGLPVSKGDFTIFDLERHYAVDPAEFLSMGRSTPFEGRQVQGKCLMTCVDGKIVWCDPALTAPKGGTR